MQRDPRRPHRDGDPLRRGRGASTTTRRARLARHLVEHGSHGLVVAGTTGEAPTLSDEEKLALLARRLDEVGGEATVDLRHRHQRHRHSVELTEAAAEAGADAALVVTPYYNKPNRAGLRAHYEAVAAAVPGLPIVLYNIPSRVVINIDPDVLAELAEIENVVAVKQANDDELGPIEGLDVLAGNDDVFLRHARVRRRRRDPRRLAPRRPADARRSGTRRRPATSTRAREIDAELRPVYDGDGRDHQPDPAQGGAGDARAIASGGCGCRWSRPTTEQRAVVRAALERAGLLAAAG